ncbi:unnamed protein product [Ostreobium quekettii]|uniref:Amidohydrolase-related domain-containing protein n=1 Tax=Ostreobium quekettii TaxID=121088 RepID=A0A8S1IRK2_9CHLO|nr:unnamed protein product [Ostreobium quekettii]
MDRGTLFLVVACQAVALAALLHRGGWDWATLKATGRRLSLYPRLYGAMGGNAWRCCGLAGHSEVLIVGQRVLAGDGEEAPAAVHVSNGTIVGVYPFNGTRNMEDLPASTRSAAVFNYGGAVVAPGIIDVHVHLNMPGREDWEGMVSGTRAAAAGGVTTVVDMPLNSHPCTTEGPLLKQKLGLAKARSVVNTGFWGGLVPENAADRVTLEALLESGAFGLKAFMSPSGINDFPNVSRHHIESAIPLLKERGMPLFVHAESVSHVHVPEGDPRAYSQYMASRPPKFESDAISTLIDVLNSSTHESKAGFRIHIAHLADANSLAMIQDAKSYGLPLTVETCPHYLSFWAEGIPDGATQYKCAPPLRDSANAIRLWDAVASGTIDMLSSDHSPAPPGMKHLDNGDFGKAWGGISGRSRAAVSTGTKLQFCRIHTHGCAALCCQKLCINYLPSANMGPVVWLLLWVWPVVATSE